MEKRVHLLVKGLVQGVFYRASALDEASRLGLAGWVRNLPDGRVEIVAEGKEKSLSAFVNWCRKGPSGAQVDSMEEKYSDATGEFRSFVVRYY